jgi:exopolysaccharide production protein ExoZ
MLNDWTRKTFELSHVANNQSLLPMEGVRGFAVFLVFLVHYVSLAEPWVNQASLTYSVLTQLHNIGNIGVDLFFVLSGYLIYGMLIRKKQSFPRYIFRRARRIYPVFTIVFLIYICLSILFPERSKIPSGEEGVFYLFQNFLLLPGIFDVDPMITVAWSLSYEVFYYLAIPVLIELFRMRSWTPKFRLAFIALITILLFVYFSNYGGHIRLLMFLSGILLFDTIDSGVIPRTPTTGLPCILFAIGSIALLEEINANGWWNYLILYCLFYLFLLECFTRDNLTSKVFSFTYIRWLGNMSYSYYLLHGLTLQFVFMLLQKARPPLGTDVYLAWFFLPIAFLITLVPSVIMFVLIEKPFSLKRIPVLTTAKG